MAQSVKRARHHDTYLCSSVVEKLRIDSPQLRTFVTLSPVPGFRAWLTSRYALLDGAPPRSPASTPSPTHTSTFVDPAEHAALRAFQRALDHAHLTFDSPFTAPIHSGNECPPTLLPVKKALMRLMARYLLLARKRQQALDPVAAFHLRNGARLLSVRWLANPTERGCQESAGMMVNYQYEIAEIERNHSRYVGEGVIAANEEVHALISDAVEDEEGSFTS
eukprot:2971759-Pleurochrysis_carterae.AAC.1